MSESTSAESTKISAYLMLIVLMVLALSIVALILAVGVFAESPTLAESLLVIGFIAMAIAAYTLFQSRRHAVSMKIVPPQVMTTIECRKCGFKSVREFQRGDFVFKELEKCQKCDDKMMITAIYKEIKEKEKTYNV
jgi:hypothetical protein